MCYLTIILSTEHGENWCLTTGLHGSWGGVSSVCYNTYRARSPECRCYKMDVYEAEVHHGAGKCINYGAIFSSVSVILYVCFDRPLINTDRLIVFKITSLAQCYYGQ